MTRSYRETAAIAEGVFSVIVPFLAARACDIEDKMDHYVHVVSIRFLTLAAS